MVKYHTKTFKKAGLAPGTLTHIGEKKQEQTQISILDYNTEKLTEINLDSISDFEHFKNSKTVSWINIDGLHDTSFIEKIGNTFGIHQLTLEDILNTNQRPKIENYEDYIFTVLKMISFDEVKQDLNIEQVGFILGPHYVLSFQEQVGDVFDPVRERIRKTKWRTRKLGSDYLFYTLIDAIVDHYFIVLEKLAEKIEKLEETITSEPDPKMLHEIHRLKNMILYLRKSVWPLREIANHLIKEETKLIQESTEIYLKDLYDHIIQISDTIETFRDLLSGLQDVYLSSISNKMNEVMKVLTIFAAIFIPLTFVAGIYGMNFQYMPELQWKYSYPILLIIMSVGVISMVLFFKKKKWL